MGAFFHQCDAVAHAGLDDATKQASFKVNCGRHFCEFDAPLGYSRQRTKRHSISKAELLVLRTESCRALCMRAIFNQSGLAAELEVDESPEDFRRLVAAVPQNHGDPAAAGRRSKTAQSDSK